MRSWEDLERSPAGYETLFSVGYGLILDGEDAGRIGVLAYMVGKRFQLASFDDAESARAYCDRVGILGRILMDEMFGAETLRTEESGVSLGMSVPEKAS